MRPLRLKLKGFTSFRDEQAIDFAGLEVFAIAGPTGSGKSSLLDAMTYALYGQVERVGIQCSQLVSQGLPRMTVTLDFRVGPSDYRITRSTPAKGAGHVLLERLIDGKEQSYGEGADRAREVQKHITKIVGLDYDAFTRSVLLPQNKFAEFLTGEPKKRREILTELLALGLFNRMAQRANSIRNEAKNQAEAKSEVLEREYAGVSAEILGAAERSAEEAAARQRKAADAVTTVSGLAREWEATERRAKSLAACATEAQTMAETAKSAIASLKGLADEVETADARIKARSTALDEATRRVKLADREVAAAETKYGKLTDLVRIKVQADALPKLQKAAALADSAVERGEERLPRLEALVEKRGLEVRGAEVQAKQAARELEGAKRALDEAEHADQVGALVADLKKGDPCPVCGQPLKVIPKSSSSALRTARSQFQGADEGREAAREALSGAKLARQDAEKNLEKLQADLTRDRTAAREARPAVAAAERQLALAFAGKLPADPAAATTERIKELERLAKATQSVSDAEQRAERELAGEREKRGQIDPGIARQRGRLEISGEALFARAQDLGVPKSELPSIARLPPPVVGVTALVGAGELIAAALASFATRLTATSTDLAQTEPQLLAKALKAAAEVVPEADGLPDLNARVIAAERSALEGATRAEHLASELKRRLQNRVALESDVQALNRRVHVFGALALELRADHIIAFLQAEALQSMATAASIHLRELSEDRYALTCRDDDEFFVVDQWCGDEQRSVRTLSGGETFLASLSLALALADQVRSLSTIERARLDSLFLDEGFGSLDPEALRIATNAVHQLAGDGRLVGVITHIRDLSEQFTRIEVEKSPRGSTLRLVS